MKKRLTTEEFIQKAKLVHGNKYDYSEVSYINTDTKVKIYCKKCGKFFYQAPHMHLVGNNCPYCRGHIITTTDFIEKARLKHKDQYDYSEVVYVNSTTPVKIFCRQCNQYFYQKPLVHIHGGGCTHCRYKRAHEKMTLTKKEFINRAKKVHGDKYDYSLVNYIDYQHRVKIKCNTCGHIFNVLPGNHLKGTTCPKCSIDKSRTSYIEFVKRASKVHNDKYLYNENNYIDLSHSIEITCKHCNTTFKQTPKSHLEGHGCPYCKQSKGELKIQQLLTENGVTFVKQYRFEDCRNKIPLPFDFYLPSYNICIEFQGKQHYEKWPLDKDEMDLKDRQKRDEIKRRYCKQNGIKLIEIKYTEKIEEKLKEYKII